MSESAYWSVGGVTLVEVSKTNLGNFYMPAFRDVLWYGTVRPDLPPSVHPVVSM